MDEELLKQINISDQEKAIALAIMHTGNFYAVYYDIPAHTPKWALYEFYTRLKNMMTWHSGKIARIQYSVVITSEEELAMKVAETVRFIGGTAIVSKSKVIFSISPY